MKEFVKILNNFIYDEYKNYQDIPLNQMDCLNEQSCYSSFSRNEKPSEAKPQNNKTQKKVKFNLKQPNQ